jgi:hypothetical protein
VHQFLLPALQGDTPCAHHLKKTKHDNNYVWPVWAVGALFRGARRIHINLTTRRSDDDDDEDDDENKPVWPTWVVGALFRGARRIHINLTTRR